MTPRRTIGRDMTHQLNPGILTFEELIVREELPLSSLHEAVLEFLGGRDDVVLYGAHAVNAYVPEPRMTQAVDLLSTNASALAIALRDNLHDRFNIAMRIRDLGENRGYRLYQVRKPVNRHLVDIRPVDVLPASRRFGEVLVISPEDQLAAKVIGLHNRRGKPKSGTDWRDIALLLLAFPDLKVKTGPVAERLAHAGADAGTMELWLELVNTVIEAEADDEES